MKLISMTDFVLNIRNRTTTELCNYMPKVFTVPIWKGSQDEMVKDILAFDAIKFRVIGEYAKFLKQPFSIGMFVPCDLEGNVLEEPNYKDYKNEEGGNKELYRFNLEQYKKAKERVLFEGFEINKNGGLRYCETWNFDINMFDNKNIEFLAGFFSELTLTPTAIKQLGL